MSTNESIYRLDGGNYHDDEIPFLSVPDELSSNGNHRYGYGPSSMKADEVVEILINYDFDKLLQNDVYFYFSSLVIKKELRAIFTQHCKNKFQFRDVNIRHIYDDSKSDSNSFVHMIIDNHMNITDYENSTFFLFDPSIAPMPTVSGYSKWYLRKDLIKPYGLVIDERSTIYIFLQSGLAKLLTKYRLRGLEFRELETTNSHALMKGFLD